jgi:chorismate synthase
MSIIIRSLASTEELEAAVDLQKSYWGEDMSDIVPHHMLLSFSRYGGHVHGAYDEGRLVGVLMGFLGAEIHADGNEDAPSSLYVMSKRMVVLPEYRGKKIGEDLKLAQRDFAIRHNIQLVTWTFDPLLSRNAYLNLHKLGAVGQHYRENYFGAGASNPVLSADRLEVNWWVKHPHMSYRLQQNAENAPLANNRLENFQIPKSDVIRLEIPAELQALEQVEVAAWREFIRLGFQALLEAGYIATDFIRLENQVFYVFTRDDGSYSFQKGSS